MQSCINGRGLGIADDKQIKSSREAETSTDFKIEVVKLKNGAVVVDVGGEHFFINNRCVLRFNKHESGEFQLEVTKG